MDKCRGSRACPFPPVLGQRLCREHLTDAGLTLTLHEMSGDRVRSASGDQELLSGKFTLGYGPEGRHENEKLKAGRISLQRKLRFKMKQYNPRPLAEEKGKRGRPKKMITEPVPVPPAPQRYRLPDTRASVNHKFTIDKVRCYLIVGLYPDGRPGELFLQCDKKGSFERSMLDSWAVLFSMLLQYGVPVAVLVRKFKHTKFEPAGVTDNKRGELRFAESILDYVAKWLELKFGGNDESTEEEQEERPSTEPE